MSEISSIIAGSQNKVKVPDEVASARAQTEILISKLQKEQEKGGGAVIAHDFRSTALRCLRKIDERLRLAEDTIAGRAPFFKMVGIAVIALLVFWGQELKVLIGIA